MFGNIEGQIRSTPEYKSAREQLIEKRLIEGLPNRTEAIITALSTDPTTASLIEEIKTHNEIYSNGGKVGIEKVSDKIVDTHFYDRECVEVNKRSIGVESEEQELDYKVNEETFNSLANLSEKYDYTIERTKLDTELKEPTI